MNGIVESFREKTWKLNWILPSDQWRSTFGLRSILLWNFLHDFFKFMELVRHELKLNLLSRKLSSTWWSSSSGWKVNRRKEGGWQYKRLTYLLSNKSNFSEANKKPESTWTLIDWVCLPLGRNEMIALEEFSRREWKLGRLLSQSHLRVLMRVALISTKANGLFCL